jgi:hypothetical protein
VKEHPTVSSDLELNEYRSLSPLALVGLVLGLCAPLAFLSPLLIVVPLAGIVFSWLALRQIASSDGMVVGRAIAVAGLVLSLICGAAIPAKSLALRQFTSQQARPIGMEWFALLAKNDPYSALEMTNHPSGRLGPGSTLADQYTSSQSLYESLEKFVQDPAVRALLALGDRAEVRYYDDVAFSRGARGSMQIAQLYAVTHRQASDEEPITFFVQLGLEKLPGDGTTAGGWQILSYKGGVRPEL